MRVKPPRAALGEPDRTQLAADRSVSPETLEVRIGVSHRIDGMGRAALEHDRRSIEAMNRLSYRQTSHGRPIRFFPVTLPLGAELNPSTTPGRLPSPPDPACGPIRRVPELRAVHGLLIPGGPVAVRSQIAALRTTQPADAALQRAKKPHEIAEAETRGSYEHALLDAARENGTPVQAICAGTWRLVENSGGQVETLPKKERAAHKSNRDPWGLKHWVRTHRSSKLPSDEPATMVGGAIRQTNGTNAFAGASSTHWAVASVCEDGELSPHARPHRGRNPALELEISAWAPNDSEQGHPSTPEAVESRHGAPRVGVQWHPEAQLDGMPLNGRETAAIDAIDVADRLFVGFAQAATTRALKDELLEEFENRVRISGPDFD